MPKTACVGENVVKQKGAPVPWHLSSSSSESCITDEAFFVSEITNYIIWTLKMELACLQDVEPDTITGHALLPLLSAELLRAIALVTVLFLSKYDVHAATFGTRMG